MAAGHVDLGTLLTINDKGVGPGMVDELTEAAPVAMSLYAQLASEGNFHKWRRYNDPGVPSFRAINTGRAETHTEDKIETAELKILDASFTLDIAAGTGSIYGTEALLAREGTRHLRSAFANLEKQIYYGTGADAAGFVGLLDYQDSESTPRNHINALTGAMVVNAGGATVGAQTSVYLMNSGIDGVSIATGNNGEISVGESVIQRVETAAATAYTAWHTPVHAWYALQWGGLYTHARICNIEDSLTDDMIAEAISLFPTDRQPTFMAMNRKSLMLLRQSRTATNPTGAPAPYPTEAFGVKIIPTDQILSTEAVVT